MSISSQDQITVLLNVWMFDDPLFLTRSIQSVRNQLDVNVDLLIVADGPLSHELGEVISNVAGYRDDNFSCRVILEREQKGLWHVRNRGLEEAKSELVALHDADDVMHPKRLSKQLEYHRQYECDVLGSSIIEFDPQTERLYGSRKALVDPIELLHALKRVNPLAHSSVMLRKNSVFEVGGYRDVYLAEDYDLWIRMAGFGFQLRNLEEELVAFARNDAFFSRRGGSRFIKSEWQIQKTLVKSGQSSHLTGKIHFLERLAYRLAPASLRKLVHSRFLENSQNKDNPTHLFDFVRN